MKKRFISFVAWVCILSLIISFSSFAMAYDVTWESWVDEEADWAASHPKLNETLSWTLDEATGTLTIDGEGWMNTTSILGDRPAPWMDEFRQEELGEDGVIHVSEDAGFTHVVITDGIKNIGNAAFWCGGGIQEVLLPDSILYIGLNSFSGCADLKTINLPEGIQYIFNGAFSLSGLESIELPDSLTMILKDAFSLCLYLQKISIPKHVEYIGEEAFSMCIELKEIILPKSLSFLGEGVFSQCENLKDIYYEGSEEEWNQLLGTAREDMEDFSGITIHCFYEYPATTADNDAVGDELGAVLKTGIVYGVRIASAVSNISRAIKDAQQVWDRYTSKSLGLTEWIQDGTLAIENNLKQQIAEMQKG